ncbi:hypothetical protein AMECASPLE_035955 [Ameca splendens]|uniref:Uncharacterized protein n=1 Tax=Ameca splendens TaxID=208324 RepID=A0ABV0YUS8_9TELE
MLMSLENVTHSKWLKKLAYIMAGKEAGITNTHYHNDNQLVQEELKRVIGDRQVQVEDRQNLPFTDAVIHETQRLGNVIPLLFFHRANQNITFQGYFIEKPAHFLNKDGKFFKRDAFLPFLAGHRMCPGESLARMELFISFATLLQHFRFVPHLELQRRNWIHLLALVVLSVLNAINCVLFLLCEQDALV